MTPLEELDAGWVWYNAARNSLARIHRLGDRYWDVLDWSGPRGRDKQLSDVEGEIARGETKKTNTRRDELAGTLLL
jgi:hypothetical protein